MKTTPVTLKTISVGDYQSSDGRFHVCADQNGAKAADTVWRIGVNGALIEGCRSPFRRPPDRCCGALKEDEGTPRTLPHLPELSDR